MSSKTFEQYYNELNKQQRLAVDTIEGPVMVIAGPGTGKTQILTLRIANILRKTDLEPEAILAVTFTEAGVIAMRRRLAEIIGSAAYSVGINTFHGFANDIIQQYPEYFPRIIGSVPATDVDQIKLIEQAIDSVAQMKHLRPFGERYHYLRDIVARIKDLKKEGCSPDRFAQIVHEAHEAFLSRDDLYHEKGAHKGKMKGVAQDELRAIEKNHDLSQIYAAYQKRLSDEKLYDYEDMLIETLQALRNHESLLLILQEKYQYILVDEHQDTNNAQNSIIELLMGYHDDPNLFIVGDEKQAIYRFQGASLENFLYFQKKYPNAKLITLEYNYRSTQTILDSAFALMTQQAFNQTKLEAKTTATAKPINLYVFDSSDAELYGIAALVRRYIADGELPEEIAVLYRTNRDAQPLARIFEKLNIKFRIESDLDILADDDIRKLLMLFKAINNFGDDVILGSLLHLNIFGLDPLDTHKLIRGAHDKHLTIHELMHDSEHLAGLNLRQPEAVTKLINLLRQLKAVAHNKGLLVLFDEAVKETGLIANILRRSDAAEAMDKLYVFLNQIRILLANKSEALLADFLEMIDRMQEHGLMIKGSLAGRQPGVVRFMTAHRAKGLEFNIVFIINAYDRNWGGRRMPVKLPLLPQVFGVDVGASKDDDERNLFYVALTRARKEVSITYARHSLDNREQLPSQFIEKITPELLKEIDTTDLENEFRGQQGGLFLSNKNPVLLPEQTAFYKELFIKRGFPVTHLNNYLKCPWQYFFVNLLRVPQPMSESNMYGDSVHKALQDLFIRLDTEGEAQASYLLERFNYHLKRQPFPPGRLDDFLERGQHNLRAYFNEYQTTWRYKTLPEFEIDGIMLTDLITLKGKIDKIELVDDHGSVIVTDYKTGHYKTRNAIEGKTRDADGNIKRQLVFYNLLLNRYKNGKYKMLEGVVDFVEPDDNGKFHREAFAIRTDEIGELEELIKQKADEIMNLRFWDITCDDHECEYCRLRTDMLQVRGN